jgi:hypothetical protein
MAELSTLEKSYLKEWEYQKSGSRAGFLILYTIIWSVLLFIFGLLVSYFFRAVRIWFLEYAATGIQVFFGGFMLTLVMYYRNQTKYLTLKLKEQSGLIPSVEPPATESDSAPQA